MLLHVALAAAAGGIGCGENVAPETTPASLSVQPKTVSFDAINAALPLAVVARDAASRELPPPQVTWTSSAEAVATVDALGVVTARGEGDAIIRVMHSATLRDSATVQVRAVLSFTATLDAVDNGVTDAAAASTTQAVTVHKAP